MTLPASFLRDGFVPPEQARRKAGIRFRRLMIATEGRSDTGKTEFILTCPGPGQVIVIDRGFDAMYDNPNPPPTRRNDYAFHIVTAPVATQTKQSVYGEHWVAFKEKTYKALDNPDSRTVGLDGDSDTWELQRLTDHGRLTGIYPQTRYTDTYAARRAFYNRLWDSGKIIIATNKVKAEYRTVLDAEGNPVLDDQKQEKREKTGEYEAQGFPDHEYLWQIRLRHLFRPAGYNKILKRETPMAWGLRLLKCKANPGLVGDELWGDECTFSGLVQYVYPHVPLAEWGL